MLKTLASISLGLGFASCISTVDHHHHHDDGDAGHSEKSESHDGFHNGDGDGASTTEASMGMDPEMMAAMMAIPEGNDILNGMVGTFDVKTAMFMPGMEGEGTGRSTAEWLLDGRFVTQTYEGTMMGDMPFTGHGWLGYDAIREAYVSVWIDSMGSWMMDPAEGQLSEDGKSIIFIRNTEGMTMKEVYHFGQKDGYAMDMYTIMPDGTEMHTMHIESTRVR